jgi:hypothetical protein
MHKAHTAKIMETSTRLHGATTQKTIIFRLKYCPIKVGHNYNVQ